MCLANKHNFVKLPVAAAFMIIVSSHLFHVQVERGRGRRLKEILPGKDFWADVARLVAVVGNWKLRPWPSRIELSAATHNPLAFHSSPRLQV